MDSSLIELYLRKKNISSLDSGFLAYLANLETVARVSPFVAKMIVQELKDQRSNIKLIASENFTSISTQCAMGNLLTDKYAEGIPYKRFYAGCDNVDAIEAYACDKACELFGGVGAAEHAYVQPHSGADANLVAFWAILATRIEIPSLSNFNVEDNSKLSHSDWETIRQALGNQKLLALDLSSGGHLTHGYRKNVSARMFNVYLYGVDRQTNLLDYDEIERLALEVRPLILLAGYSAYSRAINFRRMREIADRAGAVLMVDMAHFAGLVAGKVFQGEYNPIPYAHVATTTTHKTLRGPRGGLVLCNSEFAEQVDKGCPLVLGGPLPHVMAAKAVCLTEALKPEFQAYSQNVVDNARALSDAFIELGQRVITGGTDNHMILLDVGSFGLSGRQAESAVRECGITLNRNTIPYDLNGPWYTSGLRLGTPAVTTLGMGVSEMRRIASIMTLILSNTSAITTKTGNTKAKYAIKETAKQEARAQVKEVLDKYPVYPEIDVDFLMDIFSSESKTVAAE
jgi:glycine hydroxymethyltransferase